MEDESGEVEVIQDDIGDFCDQKESSIRAYIH